MSLTQKDLDAIKDLMKITIDEELEAKLEEKLTHFTSKEEFFSNMDKIMGELKAVREEITMLSDLNRKVNDHEDRIEKVEKKLGVQLAI